MRQRILSAKDKEAVIKKVSHILGERDDIIFAYIFGSFVSEEKFNDIDIGVFISDLNAASPLKLELEIEAQLEDAIRMPTDVKVINNAPLTFVYHVLKGGVVTVDKNNALRVDFEGLIYKKYFDFHHLRREYLREVARAPL